MKKILILNYEFPPLGGGAGNATYYLLKEFSKRKDLQVDLVTSSVEGFKTEKFSSNIKIHYLDIGKKGNFHFQSNKDLLKYSYKSYFYTRKLMKKDNYDLIHAFFGIPCGFIALALSKKFKVPYIVSLRGSDVPFYNKRFYYLDKFLFRFLSKKIWRDSSFTICNSSGLKELALKTSPKQEIGIIMNGVDTDFFKPLNKKNKVLRVISTGRLISRKGYSYLIKACKDSDLELVFAGDGPLRSELENLCKENKVKASFNGILSKEKIALELQKSDVFALPSFNEGMSNSALEAMSCGLPLILTDVGGSKEIIKGNGFIVKPGSVKQIREALKKYLEDKALVKKQGLKSRELALKMSWKKVSEEYISLYRKSYEKS